jgi:hypothetical protein
MMKNPIPVPGISSSMAFVPLTSFRVEIRGKAGIRTP